MKAQRVGKKIRASIGGSGGKSAIRRSERENSAGKLGLDSISKKMVRVRGGWLRLPRRED